MCAVETVTTWARDNLDGLAPVFEDPGDAGSEITAQKRTSRALPTEPIHSALLRSKRLKPKVNGLEALIDDLLTSAEAVLRNSGDAVDSAIQSTADTPVESLAAARGCVPSESADALPPGAS